MSDEIQWKPRKIQKIYHGPHGPDALWDVIRSMDVVNHPRYRATETQTWCNIFVWDVSCAMGSEIPHWYKEKFSGLISSDHEEDGACEMTAQKMVDWFQTGEGRWSEETAADAAAQVSEHGSLCVAWLPWLKAGDHAHVAVLVPSDGKRVRIAQAGRKNFVDEPLERGFGSRSGEVRFFMAY